MKTLARPALRSAATSISTMAGVRIRALTERHPIKPTSPRCHSAWQLNLGRHSTYRRGKSVQTTGTTSLQDTAAPSCIALDPFDIGSSLFHCRNRARAAQKPAARTDVRLLGNSCSSRTRSESAGQLPRISPYRIGTSRRDVCAVSGSLRLPILGSHSLEDLLSVVQNVRNGCAPWQGCAFQWVQVPPGERSSRKQPEQLWRRAGRLADLRDRRARAPHHMFPGTETIDWWVALLSAAGPGYHA